MIHREPAVETIPNLAPMVDVVMVILVFFILGATLELTREGAFVTELDARTGPGGGEAIEIIPSIRIGLEDVSAGQSCRAYANGEEIEGGVTGLRALMTRRRSLGADPHSPVVIGAQSGVRWRFVMKAMDACTAAGFDNIQFSVALGS
ncbi:MAG: biopolymer transporter ExbD [Phycisphaerales bacterium]|nr:biopolymer transporter ExbD [Phycisphaerales bacterium]